MKKSVKKLYDFLNNYVIDECDPKIKKLIMDNIENISYDDLNINSKKVVLYIDRMKEEDKIKSREYMKIIDEVDFLKCALKGGKIDIFNEFDILSKYLVISVLSTKECFEVITTLIKSCVHDLEKYENDGLVDYKKLHIINFSKFNELSSEEKTKIIDYFHYSSIKDDDLKEEGILKKETVLRYTVSNPLEFTNQIYRFKRLYLDKKGNFSEFDINDIISSLLMLKIDRDICVCIKELLYDEVKKRNDKVVTKRPENRVVSSRRYREECSGLKKELRRYYDFYNREKCKELTLDEIKECLYLLIKLGFSDEDVQKFLSCYKLDYKKYVSNNVRLVENENPISLYLKLYDRLCFYEKKVDIKQSLKYIEDCFKEIFICDCYDYYFYRTEIEGELLRILNMLPQDYEYELKEVNKRIKLEKK